MKEQKNNLVIPASIILAGFLVAAGIYLSNKGNAPVVNTNVAQNSDIVINPISKTDHILGNPDAPITIVEFSDTECPYCKMFETTMHSVIDKYGKDGKVAWVYRYFPLDQLHSKSRNEAAAVECVSEQGGNTAFWKMLDTVYKNTPSNDGLDPAKLPEFAKQAGVDVTKFNACLTSGKYSALVEADFQDGVKAGAHGTPYNVMILKNPASTDVKNSIDAYVVKNQIIDSQTGKPLIFVSSDKKEVVLSGAMPVEIISAVIDMILK